MKGILFTPENIKAIVEDRKTQIRRLAGLNEINKEPDKWVYHPECSIPAQGRFTFFYDNQKSYHRVRAVITVKPRCRVGEVVYIKEAMQKYSVLARYASDNTLVYFHQSANLYHWRWKRDILSPMFLPAEAARYFLTITDVYPQRLQEITEEDALAEGITIMQGTHQSIERDKDTSKLKLVGEPQPYTARYHFQALWDSINKKLGTRWEDNPWVWVYHFELVKEG